MEMICHFFQGSRLSPLSSAPVLVSVENKKKYIGPCQDRSYSFK